MPLRHQGKIATDRWQIRMRQHVIRFLRGDAVLHQEIARQIESVACRILGNVASGKGKIIDSQEDVGGYGTIAAGTSPKDTDRDGMPDAWEIAYGTDPTKADHNGDRDDDGWTNLEEYLHDAANP